MTDRRYGVNKYGDGKLYGVSTSDNRLLWDVSFDWDGDGIFESNEAYYFIGMDVSRGRQGFINENGIGFKEIPTGRAVLKFNNSTKRYDAWNTSSAIYPYVNYGVAVQVRVRPLTGSTIYPVIRGIVSDIQASGYGEKATVSFTILDGLEYMRNTNARVAMQQNITVDDAINLVVSSSGYPYGGIYDTSIETIPYWWSNGNDRAMTELERLSNSFMGYVFADRQNKINFVARGTPKDIIETFEQGEILKDVYNPQPYSLYRNVVRLKVHPRTSASTGTIFQMTEVVSIAAGETFTFFADYSYNNEPTPAINVVTPVATTDYLFNSQADGGGTNYTSNLTITFYDFGESAKVSITNGGSTGYLTLFKIRGDAIYETDTNDVTYPSDTSSILSPREMFIDLEWQQNISTATDIANVQGSFYTQLHPMPVIKIDNRPDLQFILELFDIVEVNLAYLGLSYATYRIGGIEHKTVASTSCQAVLSTFYLEPYISAGDYMQWDTNAVWDTSTIFGW